MEYVVRVKENVRFSLSLPDGTVRNMAPGGIRLLAAADATAQEIGHDMTVTSAMDGTHSGPDDPHPHGNALDLRSHDLPDKLKTLEVLQKHHGPLFYSFLEDEGTDNEHIHAQVRKGTIFPPNFSNLEAVQDAAVND